jgi:hypothetical protein
MLTDEQCREIWESGRKFAIDSAEGKQIMEWLRKDVDMNVKKHVGWVSGIQK